MKPDESNEKANLWDTVIQVQVIGGFYYVRDKL